MPPTPDPAATRPAAATAAPAPYRLVWSGLTHPGKVRENNEDTFLALNFDGHELRYLGKTGDATLASADFLFAVSDGMGGAKAGEFASRITVDRITRRMPSAFRLAAMGLSTGFADVLQALVSDIHRDLEKLGQSYEECNGMGATLSLAWFTPGWMHFCHIGDSRIYYLPAAGGITQVSRDDTHVGWLQRKGEINEREARIHPRKNALQQALGGNHQFVDPQVGAIGCEIGDRFLICSDGVIDGLWDYHLEESLRTPDAEAARLSPAGRLVQRAVELSGRDNTTAVVIEIRSAEADSGHD